MKNKKPKKAKKLKKWRTVYVVPQHVGTTVAVPKHMKVTFY